MKKRILPLTLAIAITLSFATMATAAPIEVPPSTHSVRVDGELVPVAGYFIPPGNNFFMLRDIAYVLNGTGAQFSIGWDGATSTITITTGEAYVPVGTEMQGVPAGLAEAVRSDDSVIVDGAEVTLIAYRIGGSNFFQLRYLSNVLGFEVDWDGATETVLISTQEDEQLPGASPESQRQLRFPDSEAELPRLQGGTLYEIVSPSNLNRFQYSNRYTFEQFFLPSVLFSLDEEVIHMLQTGDLNSMRELVFDAWTAQVLIMIAQEVPDIFDEFADMPDIVFDVFAAFALNEVGLGDEHIVEVSFEELNEYTNAFIIEMKDVQAGLLSTFVGIAYNDINGLFMFTLERAAVVDAHVFCALHISFRGSFFPIENTREAFAAYIGYAMDGALGDPGATTARELWDLRVTFE